VVIGLVVLISVLAVFRKLAPQLTNRWLAAASISFSRSGAPVGCVRSDSGCSRNRPPAIAAMAAAPAALVAEAASRGQNASDAAGISATRQVGTC
jgi:hypothetical protein